MPTNYWQLSLLQAERIRNERCVELAFEGHHYYHDIRRRMIAPQRHRDPTGMYIEKTDARNSIRVPHSHARRDSAEPAVTERYMYHILLPTEEANKMKNFVNNEIGRTTS